MNFAINETELLKFEGSYYWNDTIQFIQIFR